MSEDSRNSNLSRFSGNQFNSAPEETDTNADAQNSSTSGRRQKHQRTPRPPKKWHPWRWAVCAVIALLLIVFGVKKWYSAKNAVDSIFDSARIQKARDVSSELKHGKPISILLLGTDTGALGRNYRGRTDTMIVATLNPKKKQMTLTSIPRDTVMSIPGYSSYSPSKINSAYDFGGAGTSIRAVQKLLNIPIDYYGLINMGGLEKIVDGVGGIDVTPKLTFKYGNADVKKGVKTHLDGKAALDYSRMRYDDPKGDYGRQTRQRQVLMAILRKSDSITALLNQNFLNSLQKQTKTDLTFNELLALSSNYRVATHHLKSTHLQGEGININGGSYEYVPQKERQRVTNFIRKALDLPHKTTGTTGISSVYTGEVEESDTTTGSDDAGTPSTSSDPNQATPTTPATPAAPSENYSYAGY